eukprot:CAMPEP_0167758074 /NCGR_PEP_ID=MMETSP0110_2-20121227/10271_1 /TAXON_ID=629695 /ORGANISM="Gymnochlora sp., Strain CCMP2014" /LENGTH=300 /DNA_ID=CAMNT_0007644319 /DNA_START=252 /DNA_END=1151 /DNA_ORIENTATION=+
MDIDESHTVLYSDAKYAPGTQVCLCVTGKLRHHIVTIDRPIGKSEGKVQYSVCLPTADGLVVSEHELVPLPKNFSSNCNTIFGGHEVDQAREIIESGISVKIPREVLNLVLAYLHLHRPIMEDVEVVTHSSHARNFVPRSSLERGLSSCWISKEGTCVKGFGNEYIVYDMASIKTIRMVQMRIPSDGPLAVQTFHLEIPDSNRTSEEILDSFLEEKGCENLRRTASGIVLKRNVKSSQKAASIKWKRATTDLQLIRGNPRTHPLESFLVDPPIDTRFLRVMCTQNMQGNFNPMHDSIGFW